MEGCNGRCVGATTWVEHMAPAQTAAHPSVDHCAAGAAVVRLSGEHEERRAPGHWVAAFVAATLQQFPAHVPQMISS